VTEFLTLLTSICGPGAHAAPPVGLFGMAALGAVGSATHCGPMCGPLALGQSVHRLCALPCQTAGSAARLRATLLGGYHAGRITTYAVLGGLAGFGGFGLQTQLAPLRSVLLLLAAGALLAAALRPRGLREPSGRVAGLVRRFGPRPGSYGFGLIMGLLPCGLIYTALLAACATASAWQGAAFMACFGAATVPALVAVTSAGRIGAVSTWLGRAGPAILALNAAVLVLAAGWRLLV